MTTIFGYRFELYIDTCRGLIIHTCRKLCIYTRIDYIYIYMEIIQAEEYYQYVTLAGE